MRALDSKVLADYQAELAAEASGHLADHPRYATPGRRTAPHTSTRTHPLGPPLAPAHCPATPNWYLTSQPDPHWMREPSEPVELGERPIRPEPVRGRVLAADGHSGDWRLGRPAACWR